MTIIIFGINIVSNTLFVTPLLLTRIFEPTIAVIITEAVNEIALRLCIKSVSWRVPS